MSGYSRSGRRSNDTIPKMISNKLITVANTGLRIETSESFMPSTCRRASGPDFLHTGLVAHFLRAVDDHTLALGKPNRHFDFSRTAPANADLALGRHAVFDHEHESAALFGHQRLLGNQQ